MKICRKIQSEKEYAEVLEQMHILDERIEAKNRANLSRLLEIRKTILELEKEIQELENPVEDMLDTKAGFEILIQDYVQRNW